MILFFLVWTPQYHDTSLDVQLTLNEIIIEIKGIIVILLLKKINYLIIKLHKLFVHQLLIKSVIYLIRNFIFNI